MTENKTSAFYELSKSIDNYAWLLNTRTNVLLEYFYSMKLVNHEEIQYIDEYIKKTLSTITL